MDPFVRDLTIVLLVAHAIGDFLLQTDEIVAQRNAGRFLPMPYLKHLLAHFAAAYLLLGAWGLWYWMLLLSGLHCAVDFAKDHTSRRIGRPGMWLRGFLFLLDQAVHVAIVVAAAGLLARLPQNSFYWLANWEWQTLRFCVYLLGLIVATHLGAVLIDIFVRPLLKAPAAGGTEATAVIPDYGVQRWIGILERSLIFLLVATGFPWAVSLLLGSKVVVSYGVFRQAPAFVVTATATSFLWALGASILTMWILNHSTALI